MSGLFACSTPPFIKICGLTEPDGLDAALESGADALGFVFFDKSPRHLNPDDAAELMQYLDDVLKIGVFVDASDAWLEAVLTRTRLDAIQFHGQESPQRVDQVRQDYALPVVKALPVSTVEDLDRARDYADVADALLLDSRPPAGAVLPGGNATAFDWTLVRGWDSPLPWMLAGGLTPQTVAQAVTVSGALAVDVSSGVESAPGVKDPEKVEAFIRQARS